MRLHPAGCGGMAKGAAGVGFKKAFFQKKETRKTPEKRRKRGLFRAEWDAYSS